jgi:type IV pilus assembly protein PilY1
VSTPVTRSSLAVNSSLSGATVTSYNNGWLLDLPLNNGIAGRVTVDPTATNGTVAFAVNFPGGDACSPSGSSYLYAVSYATGATKLTTANYLTPVQYTSIQSGLVTDLSFFVVAGTVYLEAGTDQKTIVNATGIFRGSTTFSPLNWREVQTTN